MSINPQKLKETHYTTREAADLLKVTQDTVKRYCNMEPIPRIKATKLFGEHGPWYIPQSSIDKYLREQSDLGRPKKSARTHHHNGRRKRAS